MKEASDSQNLRGEVEIVKERWAHQHGLYRAKVLDSDREVFRFLRRVGELVTGALWKDKRSLDEFRERSGPATLTIEGAGNQKGTARSPRGCPETLPVRRAT